MEEEEEEENEEEEEEEDVLCISQVYYFRCRSHSQTVEHSTNSLVCGYDSTSSLYTHTDTIFNFIKERIEKVGMREGQRRVCVCRN